MSSLQRKLLKPQQVLCRRTAKRYDTSAFNWHKIRVYEGPLRCPSLSTSWAPRFPLVGGREPPRITKPAYESLPEEENSRLRVGCDGVQRIDAYLSSADIRLGTRTDIMRWIEQGRIEVNGKVLHTSSHVSEADDILFDKRPISEVAQRTFLVFKPSVGLQIHPSKDLGGKPDWIHALPDVVSGSRPAAMDLWFLLPQMHTRQEGLLLLTSDLALAQKLHSPDIEMTYKFDLSAVGSTVRCDQLALDSVVQSYAEQVRGTSISLVRIPDVDTLAERELLLLQASEIAENTPLLPEPYKPLAYVDQSEHNHASS